MRIHKLALGLGAAVLAFAAAATAHEIKAGDVTIVHPWARATMTPMQAGAVYLAIVNDGAGADRLLGASTPVAAMAMLHRSVDDGGVARMVAAGEIDIAAGGSVVLEPGGLHLMLTGLGAPLVDGETFALTLRFARAGDVEVTVEVENMAVMNHLHAPAG